MALTGRNCVFMLLLLATVCLQFQHGELNYCIPAHEGDRNAENSEQIQI